MLRSSALPLCHIPPLLFLTLGLNTATAQTQVKNSEGESVFDYYEPAELRFQAGIDDPVALSGAVVLRDSKFIGVTNKKRTVTKQHALVLGASLLNSGDQLDLTDLGSKAFGWKINAGYQIGLDSIPGLNRTNGTWSGGLKLSVARDNFTLFDPLDSSSTDRKPCSYGASFSISRLFPRKSFFRSLPLTMMLHGLINIESTWNKDDLISFIDLSGATQIPGIVAFENESGKYGALKENIFRYSVGFSAPLYWWHMTATPYFTHTRSEDLSGVNRYGILVGLTSGMEDEKVFRLPSSLCLGIEGTSKNDTLFFLTGSFKIAGKGT